MVLAPVGCRVSAASGAPSAASSSSEDGSGAPSRPPPPTIPTAASCPPLHLDLPPPETVMELDPPAIDVADPARRAVPVLRAHRAAASWAREGARAHRRIRRLERHDGLHQRGDEARPADVARRRGARLRRPRAPLEVVRPRGRRRRLHARRVERLHGDDPPDPRARPVVRPGAHRRAESSDRRRHVGWRRHPKGRPSARARAGSRSGT